MAAVSDLAAEFAAGGLIDDLCVPFSLPALPEVGKPASLGAEVSDLLSSATDLHRAVLPGADSLYRLARRARLLGQVSPHRTTAVWSIDAPATGDFGDETQPETAAVRGRGHRDRRDPSGPTGILDDDANAVAVQRQVEGDRVPGGASRMNHGIGHQLADDEQHVVSDGPDCASRRVARHPGRTLVAAQHQANQCDWFRSFAHFLQLPACGDRDAAMSAACRPSGAP